MENFKDIDTTGIQHGQRVSAAQFRKIANIQNNKKEVKSNINATKKKKSSNKTMNSALKHVLPWHTSYTAERCRLDSDPAKKRADLEYYYQVCIFEYIAIKYPHLERLAHASPNGGRRIGNEGARFKYSGTQKGQPDIQIMTAKSGHFGLFIELKKYMTDYSGESTALKQVSFDQHCCREALLGQNFLSVVCYGFNEAKEIIDSYLNGDLSSDNAQVIINRWNDYNWQELAPHT